MDATTQKYVIIALAIIAVAGLAYWIYMCSKPKKEGYINANALTNVGIIDNYNLVDHPSPDSVASSEYFADLVDQGNQNSIAKQQVDEAENPIQRFNRLHDSKLLPKTAAGLTPYNVEVANPATYSFAVTNPRVQLKDPLAMRADPYRGDIAITYHPNVAMVGKSIYGRDSLKYAAYFNQAYQDTFHRDTGKGFGYVNMPIHVAAQETIMDY